MTLEHTHTHTHWLRGGRVTFLARFNWPSFYFSVKPQDYSVQLALIWVKEERKGGLSLHCMYCITQRCAALFLTSVTTRTGIHLSPHQAAPTFSILCHLWSPSLWWLIYAPFPLCTLMKEIESDWIKPDQTRPGYMLSTTEHATYVPFYSTGV
jgi:hypothetical protein